MQDLKVGDKVVINESGLRGEVVRTDAYNVLVMAEDGKSYACHDFMVTKQQFLTEIENDGKDIL